MKKNKSCLKLNKVSIKYLSKLIFLSALFTTLVACDKRPDAIPKPALERKADFIVNRERLFETGETTPIVFKGNLYLIHNETPNIQVTDILGNRIHLQESRHAYISAFVYNDTVYVYGQNTQTKFIEMISTTDLINWTAPREILKFGKLFNTSITIGKDNKFIMALEYHNYGKFNPAFFESTDLVNWKAIGKPMMTEYYVGAPTIRYFAPYYYVFYISRTAAPNYTWNTNVARSTDLVTWEDSQVQVLAASDEKMNNASDIDFEEYNGVTHIVYINNSQTGAPNLPDAGLIKAEFNGTVKEFCEKFFE